MYKVFKKYNALIVSAVLICTFILIDYNFSILFLRRDASVNIYSRIAVYNPDSNSTDSAPAPPEGYLVWNDHCRMPDVYPFSAEAMQTFEKKNYTVCSDDPSLTKVLFGIQSRTYSLHIDESAKQILIDDDDDLSCCYQSVLRSGSGEFVDKEFKLNDCVPFSEGYVLPPVVDSVIINCESVKTKKKIQQDAYFFVREKLEIRQRLNSYKNSNEERPVSVLLWGIDSMSRFNLRRTMPETTARLLNDSWFELSGYNKIDDNTFPNLMALLSGYSKATAYDKCGLPVEGGLDNCNIIWDLFREYGYVTGYAEDETWMNTFDYVLRGFIKIPVDYYYRPFMLAIDHTLEKEELHGMTYCLGRRHSAEYIYDFALEFATRYKDDPYFALFWTNTFTHDAFDGATAMDTRIVSYIDEMEERGILNNSIVIFFSDHGARFGPLRYLKQGFLEERLPFIFIWLPPWYRAKYPEHVEALKVNRYRLTNPYDIHMTLKHILELSGRMGKLPKAEDCPNCQSLFVPVPEQRSCKDISIDDHWCTCVPYENVATGAKVIVKGVRAVLNHLNFYLKSGKFSPPCTPLILESINEAQIKVKLESDENTGNNTDTDIYRIRFTVESKSNMEVQFEASVTYLRSSETYEIIDSVSRLDSYKNGSWCISDKSAKKYCICEDEVFIQKLMAVFGRKVV